MIAELFLSLLAVIALCVLVMATGIIKLGFLGMPLLVWAAYRLGRAARTS